MPRFLSWNKKTYIKSARSNPFAVAGSPPPPSACTGSLYLLRREKKDIEEGINTNSSGPYSACTGRLNLLTEKKEGKATSSSSLGGGGGGDGDGCKKRVSPPIYCL
jgi:hypothetical protein